MRLARLALIPGMLILPYCLCSVHVNAQAFTDEEVEAFTADEEDNSFPYAERAAALKPWSDELVESWYRRNWKTLARGYVKIGDDFFRAPKYENKEDSSRKKDYFKWIRENTKTRKVGSSAGGTSFTKTITLRPSKEEAHVATRTLPDIKQGEWGYIHSIKVTDKFGPNNEYVVGSELQVIDAQDVKDRHKKQEESNKRKIKAISDKSKQSDTRTKLNNELDIAFQRQLEMVSSQDKLSREEVYLVGFDAYQPQQGDVIKPKSRFDPGIKVVVVLDDLYNLKLSSNQEKRATRRRRSGRDNDRLILIPAEKMRTELTEAEFLELIESAGITKEQFVAMARVIDEETTGTRVDLLRLPVQQALTQLRWKKYKDELEAAEEEEKNKGRRVTRNDTTQETDDSGSNQGGGSLFDLPEDATANAEDANRGPVKDPKQTERRRMPKTDY